MDVLLIVGVIAAMGLVAALLALTLGRRIARRSRVVAVLLCGLLPSIALLLIQGGIYTGQADVPGDGPAMSLAGAMIFSVISLPATLIGAAIVVWRRHRAR